MIPRSTKIGCTKYVCERVARRYWALRDSGDAIIFRVVELTDSVKVNARAIISQFVVYSDDDGISPVGSNDGQTVDCVSDTVLTIRGNRGVGDVEIIVHCPASLGREFLIVCSDVGAAVWQRTALSITRYAVFIDGLTFKHRTCFRSALGKSVSASSC